MPAKLGITTVVDGEKEFNEALKNINTALKQSKAEMELVTATYSGNKGSVEALTSTLDAYNVQADAQREKIELIRTRIEALSQAEGDNTEKISRLTLALTQAQTEYAKTQNRISEVDDALSDMGKAADKASNSAEDISDALEDTEASAEDAEESVDDVAKALQDIKAAAERSENVLGNVFKLDVIRSAFDILSKGVDIIKSVTDAIRELSEHSGRLEGELTRIDAAFDRCKQKIGNALVPVLREFRGVIIDIAEKATEKLIEAIGWIEENSTAIGQKLSEAVDAIFGTLEWIIENGENVANAIKVIAAAITVAAVATIAMRVASGDIIAVIQLLVLVIGGLEVSTGAVSKAFETLGQAWEWFKQDAAALVQSFTDMNNTITDTVEGIKATVSTAFENLKFSINDTLNNLKSIVSTAVKDIFDSFKNGDFSGIVDAFQNMVDGILNTLSNFKNSIHNIGQNIIDGLTDGIQKGMEKLKEIWENIIDNDIIRTITSLLGINSPSTVMRGFGKNTGEGYIIGLTESMEGAEKPIINMINRVNNTGASGASRSIPNIPQQTDDFYPVPAMMSYAAEPQQNTEYNITLMIDSTKLAELIYSPLKNLVIQRELKGFG